MFEHFSVLRVAQAIVLSAIVVSPAFAQTSTQMSDAKMCTQNIADAKQAREEGPEISDRAGKAFDEIIELAAVRCAEKSYTSADQLVNIAKGMVASE